MRLFLWIATIFALFFLLLDRGALAGDQPKNTNAYGWAWVGAADAGGPPTYGWLSVNCNNFVNSGWNDTCGTSKYGLHVDPVTGNISGYAWSAWNDPASGKSGLGWIDFRPSPFPYEPPDHIVRGEPQDGTKPSVEVSGWFMNETLFTYGVEDVQKPDWGWILVQEGGSPNGAWLDYSVNPPEFRGWMWSDGGTDANGAFDPNVGLGWMSLNCSNDEFLLGDPTFCRTKSNYKVKFDNSPPVDGYYDLIGYAWIGAKCVEGEIGGNCINGKQTNPVGWVSMSCKNDEALPGGTNYCINKSSYQVKYNPETGAFKGYAYIGGENGGGMWLNSIKGAFPDFPQHPARFFFQDTPGGEGDTYDDLDGQSGYQAGQVAGWARVLSLKDYGITKLGVPSLGWVQLRGNWATEDPLDLEHTQGTWIDFDTGAISGWAWGGSVMPEYKEFAPGWIQFSGKTDLGTPFSPTYQAPYVTAEEGNVYAQESVGIDTQTTRESFAPPTNRFNASYLIQSNGDIVHYKSENKDLTSRGITDLLLEDATPLTFPQAGNRYRNVLGTLDIAALTTKVDSTKNRFGHEIVEVSENELSKLFPSGKAVLGGKIYVITPTNAEKRFTIDTNFSIENGNGNTSGAGLIIINGDLLISKNVTYDNSKKLSTIAHLGSAAWVVKGDIDIQGGETGAPQEAVTKLAGAYIALGKDNGTGGELTTGLSETQSLTVSGLFMARSFNFGREFIGTFDNPKPAEAVIYDGRLHANVPPGLEDFTAGLPVARPITP